jgi:hypothetical protein
MDGLKTSGYEAKRRLSYLQTLERARRELEAWSALKSFGRTNSDRTLPLRPLSKWIGISAGAKLSLFDDHGRGRIPFHEMYITVVFRDEYAVVVSARLGSYNSGGFSILAVDLNIAVGKGIVVFREPDGETVNATMPNHSGIRIDG